MEARKLQEVGGGTFTISVPPEWAERHGLTAGDSVWVRHHTDGTVTLEPRPPDGAAGGEVAVEAGTAAAAEQAVRAAYVTGASEIRVAWCDAPDDARSALRRVARTLCGLTVTESSDVETQLRVLLDADEVSIGQSVRQLQFIAVSMQEDAMAALAGDLAGGFTERDDDADRLYAMVERYFMKALSRLETVDRLGTDRPELFELRATARELERVADHAERIGRLAAALDDLDAGTVERLQELAADARGVVEDAVPVVLGDASVAQARRALATRDAVQERASALGGELFELEDADYRLVRVVDSLRRTAEHGGNIAEFGIRAAIRRDEVAAAPDSDSRPDSSRDPEPSAPSDGARSSDDD